MNARTILSIAFLAFIFGFLLLPMVAPPLVQAADPKDPGFQLLPDCTASDPIKDGANPCNLTKFQELIVNIITWLFYIVIPIAIFIFGWAGFMILTSAGNAERVSSAKSMIKVAIIGIVIVALALIIIQNVFRALNVKDYNINA